MQYITKFWGEKKHTHTQTHRENKHLLGRDWIFREELGQNLHYLAAMDDAVAVSADVAAGGGRSLVDKNMG